MSTSSDEDYSITPTADADIIVPKRRQICQSCGRPLKNACLCDALPETPFKLEKSIVVMLQHPFELKRPLATEPLIRKIIEQTEDNYFFIRCKKYSPNSHPKLTKLMEDNKDSTMLLYPRADSTVLHSRVEAAVDSGGEQADSPKNILVILDGTWRQAKWMYNNSPFLHQFKSILVKNNKVSDYVIRTQPTEESLCTLEAVGLALEYLGESEALNDALGKALKRMCEIQVNFGAEKHQSKQYLLAHGMIAEKGLPTRTRKKNRQLKLIDQYYKDLEEKSGSVDALAEAVAVSVDIED